MTPFPLPDESYGCYVSRLARIGTIDRTKIGRVSSHANRLLSDVYCRDHELVDEILASIGHRESSLTLLGTHNLLRAFVPRPNLTKLIDNPPICGQPYRCRITELVNSVFCNSGVCPYCIEEDLDNFGFWYSRRMHRIALLPFCSTHFSPIARGCPECLYPFRTVFGGSFLRCGNCKYDLRSLLDEDTSNGPGDSGSTRLVNIVSDLLIGRIGGNLDIPVLLQRLGIDNVSQLPQLHLSRRVLTVYGKSFLDKRYLNPYSKYALGWPSRYIAGRWYDVNIRMEVLLAGLLTFEERQGIWRHEVNRSSRDRQPLDDRVSIRILKLLLGGLSPKRVARMTDVSEYAVKCIRSKFPGLTERLKSCRSRRRKRLLRRLARARIYRADRETEDPPPSAILSC